MNRIPQPALWVDSVAAYPYSEHLEKLATFKSAFGEEVCLSTRKHDLIFLPRQMASSFKSDRRVSTPPTGLVCAAPPRDDDQARCIKESVELLKAGVDHVLEAPTGWGKSYAGVAILCALQQKTLIVVTKTDLIDGWKKNLIQVAKIDPRRIGHVQGDICDWRGKDVVIGMAHSLVRDGKYPPEFYEYFGLFIQDEVHRVGADFFMQVCNLVKARLRLGLSATPKRPDGKMQAVYAHIGQVLVQGKNIPMIPKVLILRTGFKIPKFDKDGRKIIYSSGKMASAFKQMGLSNTRNDAIINFVKQAYASGYNIVIMSDLIEGQLSVIYSGLIAYIPALDMGWYIGGKKSAELKIAAFKRIVFTTYQMCSEGTDYPHWDCLIMGTPRANAEQPIGRVLRKMPGKRQPLVMDLVDDNANCHGYHMKRLKYYYKIGADIIKIN